MTLMFNVQFEFSVNTWDRKLFYLDASRTERQSTRKIFYLPV